jgi:hypothetical protein
MICILDALRKEFTYLVAIGSRRVIPKKTRQEEEKRTNSFFIFAR